MVEKGNIVFYNDPGSEFGRGDTVWPAIVTQVHSEDCVNLMVFGEEVTPFKTSVMRDVDSSGPIAVGCWRAGPFVE